MRGYFRIALTVNETITEAMERVKMPSGSAGSNSDLNSRCLILYDYKTIKQMRRCLLSRYNVAIVGVQVW